MALRRSILARILHGIETDLKEKQKQKTQLPRVSSELRVGKGQSENRKERSGDGSNDDVEVQLR